MQLSISTSAIADIVAANLNHMLVDWVSQNVCELYLIQSCVSSTLHYMDIIIERSYRPSSRSTQWGDLARNFTGHRWVSMLGFDIGINGVCDPKGVWLGAGGRSCLTGCANELIMWAILGWGWFFEFDLGLYIVWFFFFLVCLCIGFDFNDLFGFDLICSGYNYLLGAFESEMSRRSMAELGDRGCNWTLLLGHR